MSQTYFTSVVLSNVFCQISRKCCAACKQTHTLGCIDFKYKTLRSCHVQFQRKCVEESKQYQFSSVVPPSFPIYINAFGISCHSQCNILAIRVLVLLIQAGGHVMSWSVAAYPFPWGHGMLLLEPIPALSQGEGRVLPGQVARALTDEQCGVQYLAQRHFDMQLNLSRDLNQ